MRITLRSTQVHMTKDNDNITCEVFKVVFRCAAWKTKSERYYTAVNASEAFEDLYHSFHRGRVATNKVTIYDIDQYDRYSNLWVSRFDEALQNLRDVDVTTLTIKDSKIILRRG